MLGIIQGKTHTVLTGFSVFVARPKRRPQILTQVVRSRVQIDRLTKSEIKEYVATGEPMDKAGAYAAQGIGMGFVKRIGGSYSNVVGLPLVELRRALAKMS